MKRGEEDMRPPPPPGSAARSSPDQHLVKDGESEGKEVRRKFVANLNRHLRNSVTGHATCWSRFCETPRVS